MKPYRGPPATLSSIAAAQVRVIVWCKACQDQVEPEPKSQTLTPALDCRHPAGAL